MWGIIGAIPEETVMIRKELVLQKKQTIARKDFYYGFWLDREVVLAESGIGKVNAAMTAQIIIDHFPINKIILAGSAGGLKKGIAIGDLVIATEIVQHDVSSAAKEYAGEKADGRHIYRLDNALSSWLINNLDCSDILYEKHPVKIHNGRILTGDRVIVKQDTAERLYEKFQGICVEMEGAAVAQVCHANSVPLLVIRVISDFANEQGMSDFHISIEQVCANLKTVISRIISGLS